MHYVVHRAYSRRGLVQRMGFGGGVRGSGLEGGRASRAAHGRECHALVQPLAARASMHAPAYTQLAAFDFQKADPNTRTHVLGLWARGGRREGQYGTGQPGVAATAGRNWPQTLGMDIWQI